MEGKLEKTSQLASSVLTVRKIYTFAWLFGFFIALSSYYVICTYVTPITTALVDEAVLPPQKGDASLSDDSTGSTYETKDGFHTQTKEIV